jgi:sugar/nucleoside kinase (ribokinase family)
MAANQKIIAVAGNVTLDIICKTVDDVPRHDSSSFQDAAVTPGGCASNTALNLAQQGEKVCLIACTGDDQVAEILSRSWSKFGIDTRFVAQVKDQTSGVSIGLVDSDFQPRFIHTAGAHRELRPPALDPGKLAGLGVGFLHIAGYFVLPGMLEPGLDLILKKIRAANIYLTLDVVTSPAMLTPDPLWPVLPVLDLFLCNQREAEILSGLNDPGSAASFFHDRGARAVVIKLGSRGCWLSVSGSGFLIPGETPARVLDTTGAGDAFAAGLLSALRQGLALPEACQRANRQGAAAVEFLGAVNLDLAKGMHR